MNSRLAQSVRRRRLEMGLTKDEAARLAKVSLSTWHTVENAEPDTTFREITLAGVASALRLDVDAVFELAGMDLPGQEPLLAAGRDGDGSSLSAADRVRRDMELLTPREAVAIADLIEAILTSRGARDTTQITEGGNDG